MKKYDYLIVGAGLYGAVMAYELGKKGKNDLVIDRRDHIAGNIYCEEIEGIHVHKYGAHIFHTSDKKIWEYMNQFTEFNNYINSPVAVYKDELYNLPFNMNTFSKCGESGHRGKRKQSLRSREKKPDHRTEESGRAGIVSWRPGYLRKADQRIYRKAMGT